jgi:hypothetical protein
MALSALRWFKLALMMQAILLAYWLAIEVLDLFPWNDIASRPADYDLERSVAWHALQQLAFIVLLATGIRLFAFMAACGYAVWLGVQLWTWWKPWLNGPSPEWRDEYRALFSRTLNVLPVDSLHPAPDVQNLVLQILTLVTLVAAAMAVARMQHL